LTTETFGPEHRPIVEFALDNIQKLKLRNEKLQYQQLAPHNGNNRNENDKPDNPGVYAHGTDRKQKSQEHDKPAKDLAPDSNSEHGGRVPNGKSPQGGKSKRQKENPKSTNSGVISSKESPKASSAGKLKSNQDGQSHGAKLHEGKNSSIESNRKISGKKEDAIFGKRKMQNQEQAGEKVSRKRPKKNKDSVGKDMVDKLDMLIEQYRSKFSHKGSQGNDGEKKQSKQLRKWFQS